MRKPKPKKTARKARKPSPVPVAGVLLQRALVQQLSFHARRMCEAQECGAGGLEFWEDAAHNCANAFERLLLDSLLKSNNAEPLAHLVDVLTGFPKSRR